MTSMSPNTYRYFRLNNLIIYCMIFVIVLPANAQIFSRSSQEYRSINTDMYEISIAKNGLLDLVLVSGEVVFSGAHIRYKDGKGRDQRISIPGRLTSRQEVADRLGQGQGMLFGQRGFEWHIRAYPTKPFVTAQVAYTNTTRNPIVIEQLTPWAVMGNLSDGVFSLGAEVENTRVVLSGENVGSLVASEGVIRSHDSVALHNPTTGRSFVAGFLTANRGRGTFTIDRSATAKGNAFDTFRADCIYDPPVILAPGERIESEVLYLAVAEEEVLLGLERFGKAFSVINEIREPTQSLPGGFRIDVAKINDSSFPDQFLQWLERPETGQPAEAFNTLIWGVDQATLQGSFIPDSNVFPDNILGLIAQARSFGYRSLLEITPFLTTDPNITQSFLSVDAWLPVKDAYLDTVAPFRYVLDMGHPDAVGYLQHMMYTVTQWGFQGLVIQHANASLYADFPVDNTTSNMQQLHAGLRSLRASLSPEMLFVVSPATMHTGLHTDFALVDSTVSAMQIDNVSERARLRSSDASRLSHLTPVLFYGVFQSWELPGEENSLDAARKNQRQLVEMVLSGGTVILPWSSDISQQSLKFIMPVLPPTNKISRLPNIPADNQPGILHAPIYRGADVLHLLGVLHPGGATAQNTNVAFRTIGLDPSSYYTVFDFNQKRYQGTAQGQLSIEVAGESARLFLLKRFDNRPTLQFVDNMTPPWSAEHGGSYWDHEQRKLLGQFHAIKDVPARVIISLPTPWRFLDAFSGPGEMHAALEDNLVVLNIVPRNNGLVDWEVQFHDGRM